MRSDSYFAAQNALPYIPLHSAAVVFFADTGIKGPSRHKVRNYYNTARSAYCGDYYETAEKPPYRCLRKNDRRKI